MKENHAPGLGAALPAEEVGPHLQPGPPPPGSGQRVPYALKPSGGERGAGRVAQAHAKRDVEPHQREVSQRSAQHGQRRLWPARPDRLYRPGAASAVDAHDLVILKPEAQVGPQPPQPRRDDRLRAMDEPHVQPDGHRRDEQQIQNEPRQQGRSPPFQ